MDAVEAAVAEDDDDVAGFRQRGELGDDGRLTLYLVDVEGLSHKEVAAITGVAEGTVKSRASRARSEMKTTLQAYAKDMGLTGDKR